MSMEENRIIEMFWARDEGVLSVVREQYGNLCRAIAHRLLGNGEDAEECENDAYLALWNAIPPARPQSLTAYLGRIVRNVALNRFDRRTAQKRGGEMAMLLSELGEVAAANTVEDAFDSAQVTALIAAFLREETAENRWLFVRRYWHGEPLGTLARESGYSENTLKARLFRQRERLRAYLQKEGVAV